MNGSQSPRRIYRSPLRQEQAARSRERIFMAAQTYLESHDIETLTLRQVAQLAGVSPPTVYACEFRSKLDTDSTANWTLIPRQTGQ